MLLVAFEAKARAAETERVRALWLARETAKLNAFAYHKPGKLPSMDALLGKPEQKQTGAERRSLMKGFAAKRGTFRKRGPE